MKVVVLTSDKWRHLYFAGRILEDYGDSYVFCQAKGSGESAPGWPGFGLGIRRRLLNLTSIGRGQRAAEQESARLLVRKEKRDAEQDAFCGSARRYERAHLDRTFFVDRTINHDWIREMLEEIRPDVMCVMGTAILKKHIFQRAKVCLNLHTGISPQYRGSASNLWPLVHGEPQYVGATVHLISSRIDGGRIVYHGRPRVEPGDDFGTLNTKSIVVGTTLMLRALADVRHGSLKTRRQWPGGHLLLGRHLDGSVPVRYIRQKDAGLIDDYVNNPDQYPVDSRYAFEIG